MASVEWSERRVHGHVVSYAESGAGPGPDGAPKPLVLLVHGIASRGQQWEPVMAELGEGWVVHGATLACGCSVRRAARARLVYPLFMAEGWFTHRHAKTGHGLIRYGKDEVVTVISGKLVFRD